MSPILWRMLWRAVFIVGCFLYAAACAALSTDGVSHSAARALLIAAFAHVVFGIDAILQSFIVPRDQEKKIGRLQTELETAQRKVTALEERISKLEEPTPTSRDGPTGPPNRREKVEEEQSAVRLVGY